MLQAQILYHHQGILVVNKPFGLPSQATKTGESNLYEQLKEQFPTIGLHHRLDQTASGLMLFTTEQRWNKAISEGFQKHTIQREYFCWVLGTPPKSGSWNHQLDGKTAITHFQRLESNGDSSKLNIKLQTGRTHQIRRHTQKAGFPILGDRRYGSFAGKLWPRLCLHAHTLRFIHPATQEVTEVQSVLPDDLIGIMGD